MPQSSRSSRNKIEPLSWQEALDAPALKGSDAFLELITGPVRGETPSNEVTPGDETTAGNEALQHRVSVEKVKLIDGAEAKTRKPHLISAQTEGASQLQTYVKTTGPTSSPEPVRCPGDETSIRMEITPGRGRSKVRRCSLAQDGHSLGEEAIYQVMWRGGRPETADPNGSRTIRIGAAEMGTKVNMAKKNVRQNVARLYEKLAIEILEDFQTVSSQARTYRVFSYKQILERRRSAGMEYVLRNKGVVFCTSQGVELVPSPAYVSSPGDERCIRPAPPKKRRAALTLPTRAVPSKVSFESQQGSEEELSLVSRAFNRYWPVDEAAAVQLIRDCRHTRPDARVEEIVYFLQEKLESARLNRSINNPVGLVLRVVPQSFVGHTFEAFRERLKIQEEMDAQERARKQEEDERMKIFWQEERERLLLVINDESKPTTQRDTATKRLREIDAWDLG